MIKSNKGFSLIELMVVVAIIGILASVAVPNFQKFQAKARQGEAKSLLSGLYMAEEAYQQEWSQYFADFEDIGYSPTGNIRYSVGFKTEGNKSPDLVNYNGPRGRDSDATLFNTAAWCADSNAKCEDQSDGYANGASVAVSDMDDASITSDTAFIAQALGNIDGDTGVDSWTISEEKTLLNGTNDVNN